MTSALVITLPKNRTLSRQHKRINAQPFDLVAALRRHYTIPSEIVSPSLCSQRYFVGEADTYPGKMVSCGSFGVYR
jgi:hypothetical protein